jgi:hypothetical protein
MIRGFLTDGPGTSEATGSILVYQNKTVVFA